MIIDLPGSVPNGLAGSRVLIGSDGFAQRTSPPASVDFSIQNLIPPSYLAAGSLTYEQTNPPIVYWRLSWGGAAYLGDTTGDTANDDDPDSPAEFGPPFAGPLPSDCAPALRFQGPHFALSTGNATDYALTAGSAVFVNNAGTSFALPVFCLLDEECDDGDSCMQDSCISGCCRFSCDDGDLCTENEVCVGGVCMGTMVDCSFLNDVCRAGECNPTTGFCDPILSNEGGPCSDGLLCTIEDECVNGTCTGSPVDCTSLNGPCRTGACNSTNGQCEALPANQGENCCDGLFCTPIDRCLNGRCLGTGNACPPPQACDEASDQCVGCLTNLECDDGVSCTDDLCLQGICFSIPNDAQCPDDGIYCNGVPHCDSRTGCQFDGPPCSSGYGCHESERECVPALSNWGMVVAAWFLLCTAHGTIKRRRGLES